MRKTISAILVVGVVSLMSLFGGSVASAQTETSEFQLKSGADSACKGTFTYTMTSTEVISRSEITCHGSPKPFQTLSAQAHLFPQDDPNFDVVDQGCLDCDYAQAVKQLPVQSGVTYCGRGGAMGTTDIEQPWNGSSDRKCLRAP